ncbi:Peptidoglycan L-alanyl-D-glutamate endopeptidase CwlK [Paenibacillus typhae]|uniref:Peptidoglycan L-alanyl-D-glutamate endopeptidase CwlK n=1 Tax=Paenibacillus typhae TaxID=1174501 RepID=A0A1G8QJF8_9BACL|nr:peptidoglycan L-alanyl-D-glutamate endopeptidase CwlK [Paenibacillus typhae]
MKRDSDRDGTSDWQEVVQQARALGFEWGGTGAVSRIIHIFS